MAKLVILESCAIESSEVQVNKALSLWGQSGLTDCVDHLDETL
jgi:hypothetical protein